MKNLILAVLLLPALASGARADDASAQTAQTAKAAKPAAPTPTKARFARVRLFLNGTFSPGSIDFKETRTFKKYAEDGTIDAQYSAQRGVGFEGGLHYRFKPSWGAMVSVATSSRDGSLSYSASVPHPLYLDHDRTVSGTKDGLSYQETAVHFDLVYQVQSGGFEILFFAGGSQVQVKTDLLSSIDYSETYPYDAVSVTGVSLTEVSKSAFGGNVGAGLDYRFGKSRQFGIGVQVRYTAATVSVAAPEGPTIDITAGGFQAAGGLRVSF